MFLIMANKQKAAAHVWDGHDTACRMWSTGGMNKNRKWSVLASAGKHPICTMCANVEAKKTATKKRSVYRNEGAELFATYGA